MTYGPEMDEHEAVGKIIDIKHGKWVKGPGIGMKEI